LEPQYSIGVFDSGVGGLTVFEEIVNTLPQYNYIYLGDNARVPYGTRSFETVYQYTLEGVTKLYELGCRLVVIACNTASAKALRTIQQNDLLKFEQPFKVLGVIRPTTEEIGGLTKTNKVGVLATPGTVNSQSYVIELNKLHPQVHVFQEACPMWVPLIESNDFNNEGGLYFIKKNIHHLLSQSQDIDTIVLGCTHYPLLMDIIKQNIPSHINVISQGAIVANSLKDYLIRHSEIETILLKESKRLFLTTEEPSLFDEKAKLFVKNQIKSHLIEI
jgi:glutamate racemase